MFGTTIHCSPINEMGRGEGMDSLLKVRVTLVLLKFWDTIKVANNHVLKFRYGEQKTHNGTTMDNFKGQQKKRLSDQ